MLQEVKMKQWILIGSGVALLVIDLLWPGRWVGDGEAGVWKIANFLKEEVRWNFDEEVRERA